MTPDLSYTTRREREGRRRKRQQMGWKKKSGTDTFSDVFGPGLEVVLAYLFRLAYVHSLLSAGCGLGNRATHLWHRIVGFPCYFLFRPAHSDGAGGDLGIWLSGISFFGDLISVRPPSLRLVVALLRFFAFRLHILVPHPLAGDMAVVFVVDVFLVPCG